MRIVGLWTLDLRSQGITFEVKESLTYRIFLGGASASKVSSIDILKYKQTKTNRTGFKARGMTQGKLI